MTASAGKGPEGGRAPGSRSLDAKLDALPVAPGVYQFYGDSGERLYVGKAKNLRTRVRSYFQPSAQHTPRTARMVAEVADLEVIVVDTELEASMLEANLIKRHRPRCNVVLRDDKSFPYLKLSTGDPYPRVSLVRRAASDGATYFGPFTPTWVARRTLKLVPRFFRVATCNEVFDGNRRPCLYYHLDQCLAPCAGKTDEAEYGRAVADVRLFLEGRDQDLERRLEARMHEEAERLEFERAARTRDTLRTLARFRERQSIASVGHEDQDFIAHHAEGAQVSVQVFTMRGGRVHGRREFHFEEVDVPMARFYAAVLSQYYLDVEPPPEVYVAEAPEDPEVVAEFLRSRAGRKVAVKVPQRGTKRRFLELVKKNATLSFEGRFRAPHRHGVEALDALAEALGLDEPPFRIECFDVSNVHGTDSVASMVAWEAGRPKKADYRSYSIRSVEGPDDYASIAEAVTRRYRRSLAEDRRLPDLVLIDGGPGQLGSAVRALASLGLPMLPVLSIAKREEVLHLEGRGDPIRLERSDPALQLVQRIRDEAHRFAVSRHRKRRTKRTLKTALTEVAGIGPAKARDLLRAFGSVKGVLAASDEAVARVVGAKAAEAIRAHFDRDAGAVSERGPGAAETRGGSR